jgi:hypothetical protein
MNMEHELMRTITTCDRPDRFRCLLALGAAALLLIWMLSPAGAAPAEDAVEPAAGGGPTWQLEMDVAAMSRTALGQQLWQRVDQQVQVQTLSDAAGFDITEGIGRVTVSGRGEDPSTVLFRAQLPRGPGNLAGLLLAAPGYQSEQVGGTLVHSIRTDEQRPGAERIFVVIDGGGDLGDEPARLIAAHSGDAAAAFADRPDADEALLDDTTQGTLIALEVGNLAAAADAAPQHSALLRMTQRLRLEMGSDDGMAQARAMVWVDDESRARQVQQLTQGLLAMAQLAAGSAPADTPEGQALQAVARMAGDASVQRDGAMIRLQVQTPADELGELIDAMMQHERR